MIPATLVASLGSVGVVTTSVIASVVLREKLNIVGKMASLLAILGNLVAVVHAPPVTKSSNEPKPNESDVYIYVSLASFQVDPGISIALISHELARPAFVVYLLLAITAVGCLVFYAAARWGDSKVLLAYVLICALTGSLNVMAAKGLGVAVRNTFEENSQVEFSNGLTYVFLASIIVCSAVQMVNTI